MFFGDFLLNFASRTLGTNSIFYLHLFFLVYSRDLSLRQGRSEKMLGQGKT
jgi:hypothetical protein